VKLLVCGPRDWPNKRLVYSAIENVHRSYGHPTLEIVAGCAAGADSMAIAWAAEFGYSWTKFAAKWDLLGSKAGPMRNEAMLTTSKPDRVLAFAYTGEPVTKGTLDMVTRAVRAGVSVEFVRGPRK
jgi:hypothetical protein